LVFFSLLKLSHGMTWLNGQTWIVDDSPYRILVLLNVITSATLRSEESRCWDERVLWTPSDDLLNQEKNQYWTVYWKNGSPLCLRGSDQSRDQWGWSTSGTNWLKDLVYQWWNAILISIGVVMRDQMWTYLKMSLTEMWKNQTLLLKYF